MNSPANHTQSPLTKLKKRRQIISLTPLIDVVFILIVFFMLTSSFINHQSIHIDTTSADVGLPTDIEPLLLIIDGEILKLENQPVLIDQLVTAVQSQWSPQHSLQVQPLAGTTTQQLISVLDELNQAHIEPMALVEDPDWQMHNPHPTFNATHDADSIPEQRR